MLTIRDDHIDNYFSDKFVHLYHVDYFINGDRQKLMTGYIYYTFTLSGLNFVFSSFIVAILLDPFF